MPTDQCPKSLAFKNMHPPPHTLSYSVTRGCTLNDTSWTGITQYQSLSSVYFERHVYIGADLVSSLVIITTQWQLYAWELWVTVREERGWVQKMLCVCFNVECLLADTLSGACLSRTVLSHWNRTEATNASHGCHFKCASSHTKNVKGNK